MWAQLKCPQNDGYEPKLFLITIERHTHKYFTLPYFSCILFIFTSGGQVGSRPLLKMNTDTRQIQPQANIASSCYINKTLESLLYCDKRWCVTKLCFQILVSRTCVQILNRTDQEIAMRIAAKQKQRHQSALQRLKRAWIIRSSFPVLELLRR